LTPTILRQVTLINRTPTQVAGRKSIETASAFYLLAAAAAFLFMAAVVFKLI
jgi:hypothetical protein